MKTFQNLLTDRVHTVAHLLKTDKSIRSSVNCIVCQTVYEFKSDLFVWSGIVPLPLAI